MQRAAPGNVLVGKRETRLPHASVVNVSQLLTIDKSHLRERIGRLPRARMEEIETGMRLVLGL
jgi:mRNA interferase MazF